MTRKYKGIHKEIATRIEFHARHRRLFNSLCFCQCIERVCLWVYVRVRVCVICVWFNLPCSNIENIIYILPAHCQRLYIYIQQFLWSIRHIACIFRTLHCGVYFSSFHPSCLTVCVQYTVCIDVMHTFHLSAIYSNPSTFQMTDIKIKMLFFKFLKYHKHIFLWSVLINSKIRFIYFNKKLIQFQWNVLNFLEFKRIFTNNFRWRWSKKLLNYSITWILTYIRDTFSNDPLSLMKMTPKSLNQNQNQR